MAVSGVMLGVDSSVMTLGNQMFSTYYNIAKPGHMNVNLTTTAMVVKLHDARHCDNGEQQHGYMTI